VFRYRGNTVGDPPAIPADPSRTVAKDRRSIRRPALVSTSRYLPERVRSPFGKTAPLAAREPPTGDPTAQLTALGVLDEDAAVTPRIRSATTLL
jgi:hypothetical protein